MNNILFTGGSGKLGKDLIPLLRGVIINPKRDSLDLLNKNEIELYIKKYKPKIIIHAAAFTNVVKAESQKTQCWNTNVNGTLNLVDCITPSTKMIYISTDYVFDGKKGNYTEEDTPNPINFYSKTKLIAENIIKTCDNYLIIRTSFCSNKWIYNTAFSDVSTNQDYVGIISNIIALIVNNIEYVNPNSILNIGTNTKSMYHLAVKTKPNVEPISFKNSKVPIPKNTSLNLFELKKVLERIIKDSSNPILINSIKDFMNNT